MDDEMGGKSKKDEKRLKELLSKQVFSLREPYGRNNVDLARLAVLCGTSNEDDLLTDPTGNRRLIPIHVTKIDIDKYNSIDKIDLIMEAYHLWKSGYKWQMTKEDIELLGGKTERFEAVSVEKELVFKYFKKPVGGEGDWFTTSDILVHIEIMTRQRLTTKRIGMVLQKNGFRRENFYRNGERTMGYKLVKTDHPDTSTETDSKNVENSNSFNKTWVPSEPNYADLDSDVPF